MITSRKVWFVLLLILICTLGFMRMVPQVRGQAQAQAQPLVIRGGTLIDGNGGTPVPNSVVVIQGNRITAVGPAAQVTVPANARVIDATGKWVLPGLWDAQTIYNWYYSELMLSYGITSNIGIGNSGEIGGVVRDAVLHGKLPGPRPFTAMSRIVTTNNNDTGLETTLTPNRAPKSAEETRNLVKAYSRRGRRLDHLPGWRAAIRILQGRFRRGRQDSYAGFHTRIRTGSGPARGGFTGLEEFAALGGHRHVRREKSSGEPQRSQLSSNSTRTWTMPRRRI